MQTVISKGAAYHRTVLMTEQKANQFAACLAANPRFDTISVEESKTAKSDKKFFVRYQPSNPEAYVRMLDEEEAAREIRAHEQAGNYSFVMDTSRRFFHCLNNQSGEVYEVTERTCSCPDQQYRGNVTNGCKHIRMLNGNHSPVRGW